MMAYCTGNSDPGLGQAQKCGGVKLDNGIPTSPSEMSDNSISNNSAFLHQ